MAHFANTSAAIGCADAAERGPEHTHGAPGQPAAAAPGRVGASGLAGVALALVLAAGCAVDPAARDGSGLAPPVDTDHPRTDRVWVGPMPFVQGRQVAQGELIHLRRWLAAGGRIDYLTTDHALMMNLGAPYYQPGYRGCGLTLAEAADELADYFRVSSCSSAGSRSRTGPGPRPTRTRCWGCTGCCSSWGC